MSDWGSIDTWIVVTACLAAMACTLPGIFLLLRQQSMMGDVLSHTVLLGIVLAFLISHGLKTAGWLSSDVYDATRHLTLFFGAIVIGICSAFMAEGLHTIGHVEGNAALGIVFTTLFALGLVLIRVAADSVHIDPDCVLYGAIETVVMDTYRGTSIPRAAVLNGLILAVNVVLILVFFKELRISAFDPSLATIMGINAKAMHYALMAITAATLVATFESVGSILVIAMLIVPPATAFLLTDRLPFMIGVSLGVACLCALLGHTMAITLPPMIFGRMGYTSVMDASTAGMMAVAGGILFVLAVFLGPRYGVVSRMIAKWRWVVQIAREDLLGFLYRLEERSWESQPKTRLAFLSEAMGVAPFWVRLAVRKLIRDGKVVTTPTGYHLTLMGRRAAQGLIRAHRLWESYMAKHFTVSSSRLHREASRVEHYIDPAVREQLGVELEQPDKDPHGQAIPPE